MTAAKSQATLEEIEVGRIYADAIWSIAEKQGGTTEIVEDFNSLVQDVIEKTPELKLVLQEGVLTRERRAELIQKVFKSRTSDLMYGFLETLNNRDRLYCLNGINVCLQALQDKSKGIVEVVVRTAVAMPNDQMTKLTEMIRRKFSVEPRIVAEVDPDILSGLWLQIGERVYDRTTRSNLTKLKQSILARSTNEI